MGYTPISMAELYFDTKIHPLIAIFFMWVRIIAFLNITSGVLS
jgi:hypothetical protein